MRRAMVIAFVALVVVLLVTTGCLGGGGDDTAESDGNMSDGNTADGGTDDKEASYRQEEHVGCQPGAVNKNGTCTVAFSGANAGTFGVRNLTAITASNTTVGGTPGYLARPADGGEYPSVVMIHEWWGVNENIRHMADVLAANGYTVFAADLYEGRVATNSSYAMTLSNEVRNSPDEAVTKLSDATGALRASPYSNGRVASLGWCFGGGWSLQLSLSDAELNSTVIYYGTLTTNETELRGIDAPVLGVFGSEDRVVGRENIAAFNETLDEMGVENEVRVYDGAGHAFANPSGESFRPNATRDAWNRTLTFLDDSLRGDG